MYYKEDKKTYLRTKSGMTWEVLKPKLTIWQKIKKFILLKWSKK